MNVIKFKSGVSVVRLVEIDDGFEVSDFEKSGVYRIEVGSRGVIESIEWLNNDGVVNLRSEEELCNGDEERREWCESGEIGYLEEVEGYFEILGEEFKYEYLNVIVE